MAEKSRVNKNAKQDYHSRQVRRNQIIFVAVAVILILSMALSLAAKF